MLGDTWVDFIMIPYILHKVACSFLHILKCLLYVHFHKLSDNNNFLRDDVTLKLQTLLWCGSISPRRVVWKPLKYVGFVPLEVIALGSPLNIWKLKQQQMRTRDTEGYGSYKQRLWHIWQIPNWHLTSHVRCHAQQYMFMIFLLYCPMSFNGNESHYKIDKTFLELPTSSLSNSSLWPWPS